MIDRLFDLKYKIQLICHLLNLITWIITPRISHVSDQIARVLFIEIINNVVTIRLVGHGVKSIRIFEEICVFGLSLVDFLVHKFHLRNVVSFEGWHVEFLRIQADCLPGYYKTEEHLVCFWVDLAIVTLNFLSCFVTVSAAVTWVIRKVDTCAK